MLETSPQTDKLTGDLAKAHVSMPHATDKGRNPHFQSKFANLQMLQQHTLPHLAKHGLAIVQGAGVDRETGDVTMTTMLLHTSGQWIRTTMAAKPDRAGAQAIASTSTYLQRMGLRQIAQIVVGGEEEVAEPDHIDDDSEVATDHRLDPEVQKALDFCRGKGVPQDMLDAFWAKNGDCSQEVVLAQLKDFFRTWRATPQLSPPKATDSPAKVTNDTESLFG